MKKQILSAIVVSFMCSFFVFVICVCAQPQEQIVKIIVTPDHPDWVYRTGEKVKFTVTAYHFGNPVDGLKVRCVVRPEKMKPLKEETLTLKKGTIQIDGGTMGKPGFLRCWAYVEIDGKEYDGCGTAAFEPLSIKPTTEMPDDFVQFWDNAKADA
ncbi:MAG: acetylxylan esterase, partial [Candidatus Latescibacteria bacterium]|nr:acetylxylan esterase [Candidatus Latescibacterota bacterium]